VLTGGLPNYGQLWKRQKLAGEEKEEKETWSWGDQADYMDDEMLLSGG